MSAISEIVGRCIERLRASGHRISLASISADALAREGRRLAHTSILRDPDAVEIYRAHRTWVGRCRRRVRALINAAEDVDPPVPAATCPCANGRWSG